MQKFHFQKFNVLPDKTHEYVTDVIDNCTPIVIDNGSYHCRVGWASSNVPELDFKNAIAKNRGNRKDKDWDVLIANEIANVESVRWLLRTPHDFNVVVNYSYQETLFDYAFKHLGINSEGEIRHPVVLTEPIANPSFCRKNMSELLFETYNIPKLAYGIDCLFSQYFNNFDNLPDTTLVISVGFQSTHVLPVIEGFADVKNTLRLNLGGHNCTAYMQRLLQLKHPQFANELNLSRMEQVLHNLCHVPSNYFDEIKQWMYPVYRSKNVTDLILPTQESLQSSGLKSSMHCGALQLERELARAEHKFEEVSAVLEIANENPDINLKATKDIGCDNIEQLKRKAENAEAEITRLQSQLAGQNDTKKEFIDCGTEKIQVPEILFQPSLVGYDQCGIKECMEFVSKRYSPEVQNNLCKNVFVTGGTANISGFKQRIFTDLQELCPYKSEINVTLATDPSLDAWKGAAKWGLSDLNFWVTKQDFEEHGWGYFIKHRFSNS